MTTTQKGGRFKTNQDLFQYADVFGVPHEISYPLVSQFLRFIENNGMEYACSRFKAMKLALIREKSGMDYSIEWFKMRNRKTFSGPFGSLQNWCRSSWKRWSKAIKLLQMYTTLYSPEVTQSQEQKFLDGVNALPCDYPKVYDECLLSCVEKLKLFQQPLPNPRPLWMNRSSSLRRAPHPNGKTFPEDSNPWESLCYTRYTSFGLSLRGKYSKLFDCVEADIELIDNRDSPDIIEFKNSVGKIGFIQEQGFKLRAVANPGRVFQTVLHPLGSRLFRILSTLSWDCTFNQEKAIPHLQHALREGLTTYSVDLSGATDYFPLSFQLTMLKSMFPLDKDHISLFEEICKAEWIYKDTTIRWKKGQPLGLFPSFASFALAHGLLLYSLNNFKHDNMFFVLGDDVVILDHDLYNKYRTALDDFQCPISESKSLISNKVAEFAGKLITSSDVVNQTKWRNVSDDSFLDVVRNLGQKGLSLLRPKQRRIARIMAEVPDFMGGLGFNPKGLPLEERVFRAFELFNDDDKKAYLMSLNKEIVRNNYAQSPNNTRRFTCLVSDPDKGSKALILKTLPIFYRWYEVMGRNLYSVDPLLDLSLESPESTATLLVRLERRLGIG